MKKIGGYFEFQTAEIVQHYNITLLLTKTASKPIKLYVCRVDFQNKTHFDIEKCNQYVCLPLMEIRH